MMKTHIKKAATVISLHFWARDPVENPEKDKPKYTVRHHKIPLLIVTNLKELISFLDTYTDFDKFHNGDYLDKKEALKTSSVFVIEISRWEALKSEILSESNFTPSWDWFKHNYQDTCIHVDRLPIGIQKLHSNQDLFHQ